MGPLLGSAAWPAISSVGSSTSAPSRLSSDVGACLGSARPGLSTSSSSRWSSDMGAFVGVGVVGRVPAGDPPRGCVDGLVHPAEA